MRYFRRVGQQCVLAAPITRPRIVAQYQVVSYDESYPDEAQWAKQLAADVAWKECTKDGEDLAPNTDESDDGDDDESDDEGPDPTGDDTEPVIVEHETTAEKAERLAHLGLDQPARVVIDPPDFPA